MSNQLTTLIKQLASETGANAKPRCPHFGACGGCQLQDLDYPTQVVIKQRALQSLAPSLNPQLINNLIVTPAPEQYEYRVKMEYVLEVQRFGLREAGGYHQIVNLFTCHLIPPAEFKVLEQIYNKCVELGLVVDDREGSVQYLSPRLLGTAKLLVVVTGSKCSSTAIDQLLKYALGLGYTQVSWQHNHSWQGIEGPLVKTVGSEPQIRIGSQLFWVNTQTFLQNNLPAFEQLLEYVVTNAQTATNLLDLYCGIGTLGLQLASQVQRLHGVEAVHSSIELAQRNANLNNHFNATFEVNPVANFLHSPDFREYAYYKQSDLGSRYKTDNLHWDTIIVDPPRAGLGNKVCRRLQKYFAAERIIYVSCNPQTQVEDVSQLTDYKVVTWQAFDLFPQTVHVESVMVLERSV